MKRPELCAFTQCERYVVLVECILGINRTTDVALPKMGTCTLQGAKSIVSQWKRICRIWFLVKAIAQVRVERHSQRQRLESFCIAKLSSGVLHQLHTWIPLLL